MGCVVPQQPLAAFPGRQARPALWSSCIVSACFALYSPQFHKHLFASQGRGTGFKTREVLFDMGPARVLMCFPTPLVASGYPPWSIYECEGTRAGSFEVNLGNGSSLKCKPGGEATSPPAAIPFDMTHTMQMNVGEWQSKGFEKQRTRENTFLLSTSFMLGNT